MMKRRCIVVVCFIMFWSSVAWSADGINVTLMNVPSAEMIGQEKLDTSITLQFAAITGDFDNEGLSKSRTLSEYGLETQLQWTYGVSKRAEIGINLPIIWDKIGADNEVFLKDASIAGKYLLWGENGGPALLAFFLGLRIPIAGRTLEGDAGFAVTINFSENVNLDVSGAFSLKSFQPVGPGGRTDIGFGWYVISGTLQVFLEWSQEWSFWRLAASHKGFVGTGINWDVNPSCTLTFGVMFDVMGEAVDRAYQGFFSAAYVI